MALVLGGTLAAVLALPVLALVPLRMFGNVLGWGEAALIVGWIAIVATSILGFLLWRLVLRPVRTLDQYAQSMRSGGEPHAPSHLGTPEFTALARSVMGMGDSLQNRANSLQAYADHVTHELKSPLTAIRGATELLDGTPTSKQRAALLDTISQATERMQSLLDDLSRHARASVSTGLGVSRLGDVVATLDVPLAVEVVQDGDVPLGAEDLSAVLTQLVGNAAAHSARSLSVLADGRTLTVRDDGCGISQGNRDRIFEPFFTTRRSQGGTGMGLSIVRSLVQARGGHIRLQDSDKGACFFISFD